MPDPQKRLDRHRRYNASAKGQARDKRYEAKHPERKLRWEAARNSSPVYRRSDDA